MNGGKIWIHNAPIADVGFVLARTNPNAGRRGMSIFIVDLQSPGVSRGPKEIKMGQRASQVDSLSFDEVRLPADALLGKKGRGFHMMMSVLDKGRVGIGALAVGIGQAGLEAARLLVQSAAYKINQGKDTTKACSIAKCFAGDRAVARSADAVQVFGGSGYIREFEVERLYRDAKITQIYEGTNQIQHMIIARELFSKGVRV